MKSKIISLLFVVALLFPVSGYPLRIDNPKMRVSVEEGKKYSGVITVENPTPDPVSVKVYLEDFTYITPFEGDKEFVSRGATKHSISDMITYSPEQFSLDPYASRQVNFTISSKQKVENTLCGVLFFETSMGSTVQDGKAIDVLGRLGSLIFIDPAGKDKTSKLSDVSVSGNKFTSILSNDGNVFFDAAGTFYVMDSDGTVYDRGKTNELFLPPGEKGQLKFDMVKPLSPGTYTAVLTLDLQDSAVATKEVDFSITGGESKTLEIRD